VINKKTICIDFDGVINSYVSGWQGVWFLPDPPVPGAMKFLDLCINNMQDKWDTVIFSSRNSQYMGPEAMLTYIYYWAKKELELERANSIYNHLNEKSEPSDYTNNKEIWWKFPIEKPAAFLTIDDRGWTFKGTFPTVEEIVAFKPWNKE
jgi:hypothetical protein